MEHRILFSISTLSIIMNSLMSRACVRPPSETLVAKRDGDQDDDATELGDVLFERQHAGDTIRNVYLLSPLLPGQTSSPVTSFAVTCNLDVFQRFLTHIRSDHAHIYVHKLCVHAYTNIQTYG